MPRWNIFTENVLSRATAPLKRKRVELFVRLLNLGPNDLVLDLGSEDGSYLSAFYPWPQNIVLADIEEAPMKRGVEQFGLKGCVVLAPDGPIPVRDNSFDAVWCNSVIEHVTLARCDLAHVSDDEFRRRSDEHQRRFAREVARVARQYFVQTPYVHFPLESHSWLPFVQYLRQERRWFLSRRTRRVWAKQWRADFNLYNTSRLREHYPDMTTLHVERVAGLPKSLIAVRSAESRRH